jgi:hypothetical protein
MWWSEQAQRDAEHERNERYRANRPRRIVDRQLKRYCARLLDESVPNAEMFLNRAVQRAALAVCKSPARSGLDLLKAAYVAKVHDAWARVSRGAAHIRHQEHRVSERKGQDASLSEALLETFRQTQALHERSCERVLDELYVLEVHQGEIAKLNTRERDAGAQAQVARAATGEP